MADMKPRHVATLALVGWCLMAPPLPHLNTHAVHKDTAAALRGWKMLGASLPRRNARPRQPMGTVHRQRRPHASRKNSAAADLGASCYRVKICGGPPLIDVEFRPLTPDSMTFLT
jgi:hypothetical protein